ncbi:flagellar export chaperone FliS [Thermodesulfobacterium hydrogeniphilum]|uniref:flagellar export chaperone FliS n=1 Tax=Thermodesulfobacterium hydrogeniphilum TaxID=161156 RepID=UPI00056F7D15|nr:flagellar export chaperone FliS [Thermodesulfobacterium hydrogeniphilum]
MLNPVQNYIENQVKNTDPLGLIIMLYNKAISCLKISQKAIESGLDNPENVKKKAENLGKATEILAYLQGCLNFEKGQEIAKNLNEIYDILINELVKANMENDTEIISKSVTILENLKKAWEDIKCQKITVSKKS